MLQVMQISSSINKTLHFATFSMNLNLFDTKHEPNFKRLKSQVKKRNFKTSQCFSSF